MDKRGQIAIYVAFGLVIVALIVLILFFRETALFDAWEKERKLALEVPEKAAELHNFMQECIIGIAEDGVSLIGTQGGYIELPATLIPPTPAQPFGKTLEIFPNSDLKTAYWFYISPNGMQKTDVPSKAEMEKALAGYINKNIGYCAENFALLEEYNATAGEISTEASIKDNVVLFTVDYPIRIFMEDFNYKLPKFYIKIDAGLGEMYDMAKELMEKSSSDFFLEEKTIDILAMYKAIPFSRTELTCEPKVWTKSRVASELKKALAANLQFIKLEGTNFDMDKDYFVWDALEERHGKISSSFRFSQNWPLKMDVYPSEGELLTAKPFMDIGNSAMAFLTALFCLTDYNFIYDIQYPALVAMSDENGFIFQFATMVVVDNNQPRENIEGTIDVAEPDARICGNKAAYSRIYALTPDESGLLVPLEDAEIKLKCISTVCPLGMTKLNRGIGEAVLEANIPQCVNALLTAEKEGYLEGREFATTIEGGDYSVLLEPYKELDYEVKIVDEGFEREMEAGETVIINIENKDKGFSTALVQPKGKVQLVAGDVDLRTTLITKGFEINIKGKEITHCFRVPTRNILGLLGFEEEQCTSAKTPDMTLDQAISGGSSTVWQIDRESLYSGSRVVFYVPAEGIPSTIDEMEEAYSLADNPANAIMPVIE